MHDKDRGIKFFNIIIESPFDNDSFVYKTSLDLVEKGKKLLDQGNLLINEIMIYLNQFNIQETYIIGVILGVISMILWCLLMRQRRIMKENSENSSASTQSPDTSKSAKQVKFSRSKKIGSDDDGYLSDSALSLFSFNRGPRFRKRDKLAFYGKKMLRTVSHVRGSISARSAEKSKDIYELISKKILNIKDKESGQFYYRRNDPPEFMLETEPINDKNDHDLPVALINLFRSVKVFGYFDQTIILEMCKYMESKTVYANNYLFKIGEPDDSIYVVESGRINVFITDEKGKKHLIKECTEGNHIFSLLSIMDVLTGNLKQYKTVSAKAAEDTTVLRLPGKAFVEVLEKYPEYLVRITQIIIVRLQRVTFTALHNYLGLTSEIVRSLQSKKKKSTQLEKGSRVNSFSSEKALESRGKSRKHHHHHFHHHHHYHANSSDLVTKKNEQTTEMGFLADDSDINLEAKKVLMEKSEMAENLGKKYSRKRTSSSESSAIKSSLEDLNSGSEFGDDSVTQDMNNKLPLVQSEIADLLKIKNKDTLNNKVNLVRISEGTVLCKEGDYNCSLIYVIEGQLFATQKELNGEESSVFYCNPNQFCANMSVISGEPSLFGIKARCDSEIAVITKDNFHKLITAQPTVVLSVANLIVQRMSPFVRQLDFALEWNLIESGDALFRQGARAETISIVLNGRLRSILKTSEKQKQLVGEFGRGDLVGLVEILMETNNATTVVAIRDTEIAQIPSGLLNYIKYRHPRVVSRLIQMLSSRLLGTIQNVPSAPYIDSSIRLKQPIDAPTIASNLCTVAILPVSDDVPLHAFTMKLCHALNAIDNSLHLTKDLIIEKLGQHALEKVNEYRLCAWLGQQEDHHRIVLYQCEPELTPWTRRCMRQADCLLIVGVASKEPNIRQLEKEIENFAIRAQKELILLHEMNGRRPSNTVKWLSMRNWCSSHHHIRCPDKLLRTGTSEKLLKEFKAEVAKEKVDKMTDFSRLARFLTGTSIGLVLGGGGARGCAHVGVIKAMIEANIPIDMIGGTSIGSFMGALWAEENVFDRFYDRAREWSFKMKSYKKQVLDLTYPVTSMFKGSAFNKAIEDVFGNRQIEDLWIPYFCVTTDISSSKMRIHTNGMLWKFVRASMTYCGILPPLCDPYDGHLLGLFIKKFNYYSLLRLVSIVDGCYTNNLPGSLWRYIRSSMSLSGYLPPLCDPIDGHLLLDGGYVNNLPADVMHRMGVNTVLAVDVGSKDDDNFTNYGDELSGWWLLWKKWNHWAEPVKVPDLTEIQSRLAYVSCERGLEMVKNSDYCEYMRPPIDKYRTLQFGCFDEIKDVGYNYGKILFDTWIKHDGSIEKFLYRKTLKHINQPFNAKNKQNSPITDKNLKRTTFRNNRYHFEDLSQFVQQENSRRSTFEKGEFMLDHKKLKHSLSVQDADDVLYEKLKIIRDKEFLTKSLSKLNDDDTDDYQNFSNLEYENDELESSYDINKENKEKENIEKLNENEKAIKDEDKDSISNRTILDTAKLSNLIRNDMANEKNEIGNLDTKLLNLAELSGDKTS